MNRLISEKYDPIFRRARCLMGGLIVSAFAISIGLAFGIADQYSNSFIVNAIGHLVPAVERVAGQTHYVASARVTIAIQWLFVVPYWACLWAMTRPWFIGRATNRDARANIRSRSAKAFPLIALVFCLVLSDFGLFDGPGFFRGTLWDPSIPNLRLPYTGCLGLAVAAFLAPFFEAVIYFVIPFGLLRLFLPAALRTREEFERNKKQEGQSK